METGPGGRQIQLEDPDGNPIPAPRAGTALARMVPLYAAPSVPLRTS